MTTPEESKPLSAGSPADAGGAAPAPEPDHRRRNGLIAGGVALAAVALGVALCVGGCGDREKDADDDKEKLSASAVVDKLVSWAKDSKPSAVAVAADDVAEDPADPAPDPAPYSSVSVAEFARTQSV